DRAPVNRVRQPQLAGLGRRRKRDRQPSRQRQMTLPVPGRGMAHASTVTQELGGLIWHKNRARRRSQRDMVVVLHSKNWHLLLGFLTH
ncbi:MAG: hypothetical protein WA976_07615, partial [Candidatus Dormiibacterota bacterium]